MARYLMLMMDFFGHLRTRILLRVFDCYLHPPKALMITETDYYDDSFKKKCELLRAKTMDILTM